MVPNTVYNGLRPSNPYFSVRVKRALTLLQSRDIHALYDALLSVDGGARYAQTSAYDSKLDALHVMLLGDLTHYRPHDLMVKTDRASMAASIEVRAPLMCHHLAQYCWHLPNHMKIRNGQGKWLLREALKQYVPENLFDRPKMGFSVPLDQWLKTDLYDWAQSLLNKSALENNGYHDHEITAITHEWKYFCQNKHTQEVPKKLWSVLMYQAWYNHWIQ